MKSLDNVPLIKKEQEAVNAAVRLLKSQFSVERVILFEGEIRGALLKNGTFFLRIWRTFVQDVLTPACECHTCLTK